jgi:hypothetical protein
MVGDHQSNHAIGLELLEAEKDGKYGKDVSRGKPQERASPTEEYSEVRLTVQQHHQTPKGRSGVQITKTRIGRYGCGKALAIMLVALDETIICHSHSEDYNPVSFP